MRNSILVATNAVLPMFFIIWTGYFVRKREWIGDTEAEGLNNVVFRFFLPCQLFKTVYEADYDASFDPKFPLFVLLCLLLILEMSRNVQSGNTQNLKSPAAPVRLPAVPAPTPGTSQAAAPAGCAYRS